MLVETDGKSVLRTVPCGVERELGIELGLDAGKMFKDCPPSSADLSLKFLDKYKFTHSIFAGMNWIGDCGSVVKRAGGRLYEDAGHVEDTSEVQLSARRLQASIASSDTLLTEALPDLWNGHRAELYENKVDPWSLDVRWPGSIHRPNRFALHENYSIPFKAHELFNLSKTFYAFNIARPIYEGAGWYDQSGQFRINERTDLPYGDYRDQLFEVQIDREDGARVHINHGGGTVRWAKAMIRTISTQLMVRAVVDGIFEDLEKELPWSRRFISCPAESTDISRIAIRSGGWRLGLLTGMRATTFLLSIHRRLREVYFNELDRVEQELFNRWGRALEFLSKFPEHQNVPGQACPPHLLKSEFRAQVAELCETVDWVQKAYLCGRLEAEESKTLSPEVLIGLSHDMHCVDPSKSFFGRELRRGITRECISDSEIAQGRRHPLSNCRSDAIAYAISLAERHRLRLEVNWDSLSFPDHKLGEIYLGRPGNNFLEKNRPGGKMTGREFLDKISLDLLEERFAKLAENPDQAHAPGCYQAKKRVELGGRGLNPPCSPQGDF